MKQITYATHELSTYHQNARTGNVQAIAESLQTNGQYKPIVVNAGSKTGRPNEVLVGNHTLQAARELGWEHIEAVVIDVTDSEARRIVLVDNRTSDLGSYDDQMLSELLAQLDDFSGTGYEPLDLDQLLSELAPPVLETPGIDEDIAPPSEPIVQAGEVWVLGDHRLACGDATDPEVYKSLLGDSKASSMWTDPPYGVEYVGKTKDALTIKNDGAEGLQALLKGAFTQASEFLLPGAPFYIAHADSERITFELEAREAGLEVRQNLIWVKNSLVMGRSDYHYRHEPILYGFRAGGEGRKGRGGKRWFSDNSQTTVLEFNRPTRSTEHPTMKPVELVEYCLNNSVSPRGTVLEPFAGSGTTLLACERTGRASFNIELDPRFCDVIIRRWEELTGRKAIKEK